MGEGPGTETAVGDHWGEIDGVSIDFPIRVDDMNAATLTYTVPIGPARALVPGDGFEVLEVTPGDAVLVVALCDYVANPWGDYDEVNLGILVHPVEHPADTGAFVYRMPVDQEFTMKAGNQVLGLPKTVEDIRVTYTDDLVSFRLAEGGEHALTVTLPRAAPGGAPALATATTFSYLGGAPTALPLDIELGTGTVDPADVLLDLGDSPVADELRSLGLPKPADLVVWGEGLRGVFHRPRTI